MKKYAEVDAAILRSIGANSCAFSQLLSGDVFIACNEVDRYNNYRVLDRRLQALRKTGKIKFENHKWHLVQGG